MAFAMVKSSANIIVIPYRLFNILEMNRYFCTNSADKFNLRVLYNLFKNVSSPHRNRFASKV